MREQGFRYRGAYHWLRSDSPVSSQAENVIKCLEPHGGLLVGEFIQSDWETTPGIYLIGASGEREFCDRLHQHYQRECTITYSSDWIPDSPDDSNSIGEFYDWLNLTQGLAPLWFANYNSSLTNPNGGWLECKKYGADVWQFTSSYFHPSIISVSGGGFDMNHIFNFDTLDRIAGYQNQEQEQEMKTIVYTVRSENDPTNVYAWFKVNVDDTVRQLRNGQEKGEVIADGAVERNPESTAHFREMLTTLQPIGALGTAGKNVLGTVSVADWEARAYRNTTINVPSGNKWGMSGIVDLNAQTIDLNPK